MQRLLILLTFFVFLISGIAVSEAAYQDNGNGTVTDTATGLMWQKSAPSYTMAWRQALAYCESLSLGGHTDWRMPTIKELKSLVDHSRYSPARAVVRQEAHRSGACPSAVRQVWRPLRF